MRHSRRALRIALACASALVLTALGTSSADAVLGGSADGDGHPNVGMLLNSYQYQDGTWILCSGSLIAPDVFLTAAHCGTEGSRVTVTFDSAYSTGDQTYTGTFHGDPGWPGTHADPHDIAVVVLDSPVPDVTPVQLPTAGSVGALSQGTPITAVGYGASTLDVNRGLTYTYTDVRNTAVGSLNGVNSSYLQINENAARGYGGGCFGDSGGPNFVDGVQVGITVSGDRNCKALDSAYRLDTPSARDFLAHYVTLP